MRNKTLAIAVVTLAAFASSAVMASVTFTPPGSPEPMTKVTIKLMGQKSAPKASGIATLTCNQPETKHSFALEAKGLDPKKVYTVWFVKSTGKKMDMAGVGRAPYVLRVNKKGNAKMTYNPDKCPSMQGWKMLEVVDHVDKNAKNLDMKNLVPVLVGDMTKMK